MLGEVLNFWKECVSRATSGRFWEVEKWTGGLLAVLLAFNYFVPLPAWASNVLTVDLPHYLLLLLLVLTVFAGLMTAPYTIYKEEREKRLELADKLRPRLTPFLSASTFERVDIGTTTELQGGARLTAHHGGLDAVVALHCRNDGAVASGECRAQLMSAERLDGGRWVPLPMVEPILLSWAPTNPEAHLSARLLPNETARIWIAEVRASGHVWLLRDRRVLPVEYQQLLGPAGTYRVVVQITEGAGPAVQARLEIVAEADTDPDQQRLRRGKGSVALLEVGALRLGS